MAGAEIDDSPASARPGAAAAEDFSAGKAADQDRFLGLGDIEEFAVHFFFFENEMIVDAVQDWMARAGDPENLSLADVAPFQIAGGSHQLLEDLGKVAAVKNDQAHACQHA